MTLGNLFGEAACRLEQLDAYSYDQTGQARLQSADGRWFIVTFAAELTPVDCPTCDSCADDIVALGDVGKAGPDGVLCKTCFADSR